MKTIINPCRAALVAFAAAVIAGCSGHSGDSYLKAIPSDTEIVASVHLGSMLEKADLKSFDEIGDALEEAFEDAGIESDFKDFIKSPNSANFIKDSGIDISKPVVIGVSTKKEKIYIAAAVKDSKKAAGIIESLGADLDKEDDCYFFEDGGASLLIGKEYILFTNVSGKLSKILNLIEDKVSDNVAKVASSSSDIALDFECGQLLDMAVEALSKYMSYSELSELEKAFELLEDDFYDGLGYFATVDFQNGRAVCEVKTRGSREYEDLCRKALVKPSSKYLEYIPSDALLVANFKTATLDKYPESMLDYLADVLEDSGAGIGRSDLEKLGGDFCFGFSAVEGRYYPEPAFTVVVELPKSFFRENLEDLMDSLDEDEVVWEYEDGHLFIQSASIAQSGKVKPLKDNFKKSKSASAIADGGVFIDLTSDTIKDEIPSEYASVLPETVKVTSKGTDASVVATFPTSKNVLKTFIEMVADSL